eukprot:10717555-Ditylum_brightwellii.AAC.1
MEIAATKCGIRSPQDWVLDDWKCLRNHWQAEEDEMHTTNVEMLEQWTEEVRSNRATELAQQRHTRGSNQDALGGFLSTVTQAIAQAGEKRTYDKMYQFKQKVCEAKEELDKRYQTPVGVLNDGTPQNPRDQQREFQATRQSNAGQKLTNRCIKFSSGNGTRLPTVQEVNDEAGKMEEDKRAKRPNINRKGTHALS